MQVLSSRDVLSNLKDERTKRKKELTNQERVGKKEFQRLQSLLTTASGKVQVTKAQINQKKKERNELDKNKKNVRENIRTNFPRSVEAERKKKRELDDDVEKCETRLNDFENKQDTESKRQQKAEHRENDSSLQRREKRLRERQNLLLKNQSIVQSLEDNRSKLSEVKDSLESETENLAKQFEDTFEDVELPRPPPPANGSGSSSSSSSSSSTSTAIDKAECDALLEFCTDVVDAIDQKQNEIEVKKNLEEKKTKNFLTKLTKVEAVLSQKTSQRDSSISKLDTLKQEMMTDLRKLNYATWGTGACLWFFFVCLK